MSREKSSENPFLTLVCEHGLPEKAGLALRESCQSDPIPGWDVEIANEAAFRAGLRWVKYNMASIYLDPRVNLESTEPADPSNDDYELLRPAELKRLAEHREGFLNVHDQATDPEGTHILIAEDTDPRLLGVGRLMSTNKVVVTPPGRFLISYLSNGVTLECTRGDRGQHIASAVRNLRETMHTMAAGKMPVVNPWDFVYYERVVEIEAPLAQRLDLDRTRLAPFEELPANLVARLQTEVRDMKRAGRYVADYWNYASQMPNWFGSVLRQIVCPYPAVDTSS